MISIGERLRQERLRRGFTLSQVSDQTKIKVYFLEAIEAGKYDELPGTFFARSFVRQYARLLDIDDSEIEAELDQQFGSAAPETATQETAARAEPVEFRAPARRSLAEFLRRPGAALAGFLALAAASSGLYFWWQTTRSSPAPETFSPSATLAEVAESRPAEESRTAEESRPAETQPKPAAPDEPAVRSEKPAESAAPPAGDVPQAPGDASKPPSETQETPASAPSKSLIVDVGALRPAWVRVISDGKVVFSGTLKPNQTMTFRGSRAMQVITGNAGGLDIRLNGKPLGPVGPEGQVRVVDLTWEGPSIRTLPRPRPVSSDPLG